MGKLNFRLILLAATAFVVWGQDRGAIVGRVFTGLVVKSGETKDLADTQVRD